MAEEEKQDQEAQEPETEAPAEETASADAPADETVSEDAPTPEQPATPAAAPAPAEEVEQLTPKAARKLARSRASGPARPERSPEERAAERTEARRRRASARRRRRGAERSGSGEAGTGTPPVDRGPGSRKVRLGTVISAKPDKTITVELEIARRHPVYEKVVRRSATVHAHDESNDANEGDVVRVVESRPLSRTKRWRLVEILERAR